MGAGGFLCQWRAHGVHSPQDYLRTIREELPTRDVTGFRFETLTDDPAVRKAADDMTYDLYGEEEPQAAGGLRARQGRR